MLDTRPDLIEERASRARPAEPTTTVPPTTTSTSEAPRRPAEPTRPSPPTTEPPAPPATVQAAAVELDGMPRTLRRIGGCESSGAGPDGTINWTAANGYSTASGGFEDLDTTWRNWSARFRGAVIDETGQDPTQWGRALYAPPEVQLKVNLHAYLEDGTSAWTASRGCWAG